MRVPTCREKRTGEQQAPTLLSVLSAAEAEPLRTEGMKPVGRYAYTIAFSDGHVTGIFSSALLQQLRERVTWVNTDQNINDIFISGADPNECCIFH